MSFRRVLVANRGEIAVRVVRACRSLGIEAYVAVSAADRDSLAARLADRAVCVGPARASESYLNGGALLTTATALKVDAIHPGYGFLSERAAFVEACARSGVTFVGPSADCVRMMGDKLAARETASRLGVPTLPGSGGVGTVAQAAAVAGEIGYPVLLKAAAGGGGRGIRIVREQGELRSTFEHAAAEAEAAFSDGTLYLERYVRSARHVEVQVFGDARGGVVHLGARDCSVQRRYQKVVEEAPAASVPPATADALCEAAVALARGIGYENAGTVEFVYDQASGEFYFLEMNTRIQVEHPVTEAVTGVDLVALQLEVAAGGALGLAQGDLRVRGHAIECRVNAEAPGAGFRPSPGRITRFEPPTGPGVRLDTHCYPGYTVPPFYDSLLAKLVVHGATRAEAIARTRGALSEFVLDGIETNLELLSRIVAHPDFATQHVTTRWVEDSLAELTATGAPGRAG